MKIKVLMDVHASGKHIEDRGKTIQKLIQKRLDRGFESLDGQIWKRDFDKAIAEIENELKAIKEIMANDDKLVKSNPTEK